MKKMTRIEMLPKFKMYLLRVLGDMETIMLRNGKKEMNGEPIALCCLHMIS